MELPPALLQFSFPGKYVVKTQSWNVTSKDKHIGLHCRYKSFWFLHAWFMRLPTELETLTPLPLDS